MQLRKSPSLSGSNGLPPERPGVRVCMLFSETAPYGVGDAESMDDFAALPGNHHGLARRQGNQTEGKLLR